MQLPTLDSFYKADAEWMEHEKGCETCSFAEEPDGFCAIGRPLFDLSTDIFLDCKKAGLI